jgi:hypothetical protein
MRHQSLFRVFAVACLAAIVVGLFVGFAASSGSRSPGNGEGAAPPDRTGRARLSVSAIPRAVPSCSTTVLGISADPDDDLFFLDPAIQAAIDAGDCVRMVYLTSGDDGMGASYYQSREVGSEDAYLQMLAYAGFDTTADTHQQQTLTVNDSTGATHHLVAVSPTNDPNLTQIYLRVPEGLLTGTGSAMYGFESLTKLWIAYDDATASNVALPTESQTVVTTVDGANSYTATGLISTLTQLMVMYQPKIIKIQDDRLLPFHDASGNLTGSVFGAWCGPPTGPPNGPGPIVSLNACSLAAGDTLDHPDHIAGANFAVFASAAYSTSHILISFEDDPVSTQPQGFDGIASANFTTFAQEKFGIFLVYLQHDPVLISSIQSNSLVSQTISLWLERQHIVLITAVS